MCVPVPDVVSTAVDISSAVEAGRFTVKWQLTDAASQTAHVPWSMKTSHLEQVTLSDRLLAAEAHVTAELRRYHVVVVNALNTQLVCMTHILYHDKSLNVTACKR